MKSINVVATIIRDKQNRFLTIRSKKYDGWLFFPGGKVTDNDKSNRSAIRRILNDMLTPEKIDFVSKFSLEGSITVPPMDNHIHGGLTNYYSAYFIDLGKFINEETDTYYAPSFMSAIEIKLYYNKCGKVAEIVKDVINHIYGVNYIPLLYKEMDQI